MFMLHATVIVNTLYILSCKDSIVALADKFHIRSDDVLNASVFKIRYCFYKLIA